MRSPDRVQLEQWLRWLRARPWQVWVTAGAVFVLFAALGAVTRSPATVPVGAHSLSDALERGTASSAAPEPSSTPEQERPQYPGMAYPSDPAALPRPPVPTQTDTAFYPDCEAAETAGVAPISRGRPGYRTALDRDGNGVACEPKEQPSSSPTTASPTPTPTASPTTEPPPPPGAG